MRYWAAFRCLAVALPLHCCCNVLPCFFVRSVLACVATFRGLRYGGCCCAQRESRCVRSRESTPPSALPCRCLASRCATARTAVILVVGDGAYLWRVLLYDSPPLAPPLLHPQHVFCTTGPLRNGLHQPYSVPVFSGEGSRQAGCWPFHSPFAFRPTSSCESTWSAVCCLRCCCGCLGG